MERKLAVILAADVVGYSTLMEQDEAGTFDRLKARRKELFEPEIAKHHGRIFKLMGDGVLAEFGSVVDAVECAVSVQRGMAERNAVVPEDQRIDVRIGINLGEVIVEGDDRYGEGVNVAARLEQLADPGGICVSGKVAKEVEKKLAFGFESMGDQQVKNIAEPVPAFRVKIGGAPIRKLTQARIGRSTRWAAGLGAILIIATALLAVQQGIFTTREEANIPTIAVLPFEDLSPDKSLGYFGDGTADDIITTLSRFPDLAVAARTSSFTYKGKSVDIRQIGKELGVGYVLEGSVRKEADKARIVAQLIDAKSGDHVWADRFDKSGADPWALQDEITAKIVGALTGEKGALKKAQFQQAWGKDATSLGEYDYYLRGHDQFLTFTKEGIERSGEIWSEGLSKYPGSELLTAKLGWYHLLRATLYFSDDPAADISQASVLGKQVLANEHLTPQVARLAHWLMAWVLVIQKDFDGSRAQMETAVAMAPYDAFVLSDTVPLLVQLGEPEKALERADLAASRDPGMSYSYEFGRGWAYLVLGKWDQAVQSLALTEFADAPLLLAIAYVRLNRLDEAKQQVAKMLKSNPSITAQSWREGYGFRDPAILDRFAADLVKASLPQG